LRTIPEAPPFRRTSIVQGIAAMGEGEDVGFLSKVRWEVIWRDAHVRHILDALYISSEKKLFRRRLNTILTSDPAS